MGNNLSLFTAFFAGVLSFVSPCVLPLLSTYLVFISGTAQGGTASLIARPGPFSFSKEDKKLVLSTLCFVLGFSVVFVVLSVLLYGVFTFLGGWTRIFSIIAGSIIGILGLNILFRFLPFLQYNDSGPPCETCTPKHSVLSATRASFLHPSRRPHGFLGSFLVGIAFGAGWTPCVGTFLGSILLLAGQSDTLALSAFYLIAYSAGLGLPFIIASFFWHILIRHISKMGRLLPALRVISGLFLIAISVLMLTGRFLILNMFFQKSAFALAQWAQSGALSVRIGPAVFFLLLAVLPLAAALIKSARQRADAQWRSEEPPPVRPRISPASLVWTGLWAALALCNAAGRINVMHALSAWLSSV
jgi:cytochrome c-type biogenesis protein